jgi:hypothetical protein
MNADGRPLPRREAFYTVVITEGEFKAAALWQVVGLGRKDGLDPVGVCALPGISFARNYEVRQMLEDWLHAVRCRRVVVAFDSEEKGDPSLPSFKTDWRKRFDANKYARYLATDLYHRVHVTGLVGVLPNAWRNSKGKADWDGALVMLTRPALGQEVRVRGQERESTIKL